MPRGVDVELPMREYRLATYRGVDRYVDALERNNYAATRWWGQAWQVAWTNHVWGAWGELAVSLHTGMRWPEPEGPDNGAPDVGSLHVRTRVPSPERGPDRLELVVLDRDVDHEPYVLVVAMAPRVFRIVGWCYGHEGKRPEWAKVRGASVLHFVPQAHLRPVWTLPDDRDHVDERDQWPDEWQ